MIKKSNSGKRNSSTLNELSVNDINSSENCLTVAENIVDIIKSAKENGNYQDMHYKIAGMFKQEVSDETYIFKQKSVLGKKISILFCSVLSILFIYIMFVGIGMVYCSSDYLLIGANFAVVSSVSLIINIVMIRRCISSIKHKYRYDQYYELLKYKNIETINNLAEFTGIEMSIIVRDLKSAINEKFIPQGHFHGGNMLFVVSDAFYDKHIDSLDNLCLFIAQKTDMESEMENFDSLIDMVDAYHKKLSEFKRLVRRKPLYKIINRVDKLLTVLLHEANNRVCDRKILHKILDCFLSSTEELMDIYFSVIEKRSGLKRPRAIKKDITKSFEVILSSFDNILKRINEELEIHMINVSTS